MGVFDYDSTKQYFDAEEKLQVDGICGTGGGYLRHRRGLSAPFGNTTTRRAPGGANKAQKLGTFSEAQNMVLCIDQDLSARLAESARVKASSSPPP